VSTDKKQRNLAEYGLAVLKILEEEPDWDGETFQKIEQAAANVELATVDDDGLFLRTEEGKP